MDRWYKKRDNRERNERDDRKRLDGSDNIRKKDINLGIEWINSAETKEWKEAIKTAEEKIAELKQMGTITSHGIEKLIDRMKKIEKEGEEPLIKDAFGAWKIIVDNKNYIDHIDMNIELSKTRMIPYESEKNLPKDIEKAKIAIEAAIESISNIEKEIEVKKERNHAVGEELYAMLLERQSDNNTLRSLQSEQKERSESKESPQSDPNLANKESAIVPDVSSRSYTAAFLVLMQNIFSAIKNALSAISKKALKEQEGRNSGRM